MLGPVPFLHHFAGPFIRQQLLLYQVDPHCPKRRSILHRRTHVLRKRRAADLLAGGAALLLRLMFDHQHPLDRQINHLPTFHAQALHVAQVSLAVQALLDCMHDHPIGRRREHQRASWVTRLSPGLLAAFLTQALGLSMKAIRGRRQVAVVAVFLELVLQGLYLLTQRLDLLLLLSQLFILSR